MNVPSDACAHLIIQTYGTLLDCGNECEQHAVILEEDGQCNPRLVSPIALLVQ